jgi:hypothetical protein
MMLRLLRYFRPVLEWLEARFAPAVVAVLAPSAPPAQVAPPAVDVSVSDALFSGGDVGLLRHLDISPAITPAGELAALALSDAVFAAGFSYHHADTATTARDEVFATLGPTQFDFVPPPPPKGLPPTQYGAHDVLPPVFELPALAGPMPEDEDAEPDADVHAEAEEMELVEV